MQTMNSRTACGHRAFLPLTYLALAGSLGLACASTNDDEWGDVTQLIRTGSYIEAFSEAEARFEANPDDPEAERMYKTALVAIHLERGRRLSLGDEDLRALEEFDAALEVMPDCEPAKAWIERTNRKLADHWLNVAVRLSSGSDLEAAYNSYLKATEYEPDNLTAKAGAARMLLFMNYREGKSYEYYVQGVRELREYWLLPAGRKFEYANKYDENEERAIEKRKVVNNLLAEERVQIALDLQEDGLYRAARNEYRLALLLDEDLPAAIEGKELMDREVEAADLIAEAERSQLAGDFETALTELESAMDVSILQTDEIEAGFDGLEQARMQEMYDAAMDLEQDLRYEEAIVAYDELLAIVGYFDDAISRRNTLQSFVAQATELYEQASQAESLEEELDLLSQVAIVWPEYKDIEQRIADLEAALNVGQFEAEPPIDSAEDE